MGHKNKDNIREGKNRSSKSRFNLRRNSIHITERCKVSTTDMVLHAVDMARPRLHEIIIVSEFSWSILPCRIYSQTFHFTKYMRGVETERYSVFDRHVILWVLLPEKKQKQQWPWPRNRNTVIKSTKKNAVSFSPRENENTRPRVYCFYRPQSTTNTFPRITEMWSILTPTKKEKRKTVHDSNSRTLRIPTNLYSARRYIVSLLNKSLYWVQSVSITSLQRLKVMGGTQRRRKQDRTPSNLRFPISEYSGSR